METYETALRLLAKRGQGRYGEERVVSVFEHSLQCAALGERDGAPPALVIAALLHDIGHCLHQEVGAAERGVDMRHEDLGADYLARWFDDDVTGPIRLHVPAKRYLCAVDPTYWDGLSDGSKTTLRVQGGPFATEESEAFIALPHAVEAVRLRRWDEGAKVKGLATPGVEHFLPLAKVCARR